MKGDLFELLRECTVKITLKRVASNAPTGLGTGFFVAPGRILTCEHVIEHARTGGLLLFATWNDDEQAVTPLDPAQSAAYPDLAILNADAFRDHPCVAIDFDSDVIPSDQLHGACFSDTWPNGDSLECIVEGPSDLRRAFLPSRLPEEVYKLKDSLFRPGMSGAGLLNLRTGKVCGVAKRTRDINTPRGGYAIPASVIPGIFAAIKTLHDAFHQRDQRWDKARDAYLTHDVPRRLEESFAHKYPLLPYLTDRDNQTGWLRSLFRKFANRGGPAICVIHGYREHCPRDFWECLKQHYCKEILPEHLRRGVFCQELKWPAPTSNLDDFYGSLLEEVVEKTCISGLRLDSLTRPMILNKEADEHSSMPSKEQLEKTVERQIAALPGATLFSMHVSPESLRDRPIEAVPCVVKFWRQLKIDPGAICVFILFLNQGPTPRGFLNTWSKLRFGEQTSHKEAAKLCSLGTDLFAPVLDHVPEDALNRWVDEHQDTLRRSRADFRKDTMFGLLRSIFSDVRGAEMMPLVQGIFDYMGKP